MPRKRVGGQQKKTKGMTIVKPKASTPPPVPRALVDEPDPVTLADVACVGLKIKHEAGRREKAIAETYARLFDGGGVRVNMSACGQSVYYTTAKSFPRENRSCPCGRGNHWLILFDEE